MDGDAAGLYLHEQGPATGGGGGGGDMTGDGAGGGRRWALNRTRTPTKERGALMSQWAP